MSLYKNINLVQIVEVKPDLLFVLAAFTRGEENWDLQDVIILVGHEDLARSQRHVKVVGLHKVRLNGESLSIEILHDQLLHDGRGLASDEALSKVEDSSVAFNTRLASHTIEVELILGTTDYVKGAFMVLESVLISRVVNDLNLLLSSILNSARVRDYSDGRLELSLPREVEAELSIVLQSDLTNLAFIDEELSEV